MGITIDLGNFEMRFERKENTYLIRRYWDGRNGKIKLAHNFHFNFEGVNSTGSGLRSRTCRRRPPLPGRRRGTARSSRAVPSASIAVAPRMFLAAESTVVHAAAV
jgi:hypothetical protein